MVGLGQAVAPTSIVDMIARVVPKEQRSSAISMAFSGTHVGAIAGMLAAPVLVELFGWRSIFYSFGALGGSAEEEPA
jgi:ACS family sodium-dependent inorganic phosphate cotransporter